MDNEVVIFKDKPISIVKGSSSLLREGVLPVGGLGVPLLSERVKSDNYSNPNTVEFIKVFGEYRVKGGVINNLDSSVSKILGIVPVKSSSSNIKADTNSEIEDIIINTEPVDYSKCKYLSLKPTKVVEDLGINVFNMLGISATGKGTRMSQVIYYLIKREYHFEHIILPHGNNNNMLGLYFPSLDLAFYGKWVRSNLGERLLSWSSYDWIQNAKSDQDEDFFSVVIRLAKEHGIKNVAWEGYVCNPPADSIISMINNRIKINSINSCYFQYPIEKEEGFELLQQRVLGRSGRRIKGTCWAGNKAYSSMYEKHSSIINGEANLYNFDAPITVFGEMMFKVISPSLVEDFIEFSKTQNTLRHLDSSEDSINKIKEYYNLQNLTVDKFTIDRREGVLYD